MFTKVLVPLLLIARVLATPVDTSVPSFNNWGIQSLQGFDDFYGSNNFDGSHNQQVVVVEQEQQVVCQSLSARIIQQRLAILQEVAKRILTEQICQVETQTVVLEQFQSGLSEFSKTVVRQSVQQVQVGFDSNIAGLLGQLINSDGSLSSNDLGFDGSSVGKHTIVPSGNNWNDSSSPASAGKAKDAAKKAAKASGGKKKDNNSSSASSTSTSESQKSSTASSKSTSTASATTTQAQSTSTASTDGAKATSA